ncbi:MAG: hypothetical protein ACO25B_06905 [Chitinophagaceae bacterium]
MASFLAIKFQAMRNTLLVILMTLHLTGNTEVGQLFRMPKLIAHFFQHHRQDNSIGFVEFIAMHYGGDDGTDADDDMDNQLPCHSPGNHTLAWVYYPMTNDIFVEEPDLNIQDRYFARIVEGIPSKHVLLILQPPRAV